MITIRRTMAAALLAAAVGGSLAVQDDGPASTATAASTPSRANVDAARRELQRLTRENDVVKKNLKTFDALDYDVFSNQKWDRLKESHAENVRVVWPDGHMTVGLKRHTEDLKQLFVYAPDTRIKEHPIKFGYQDKTAVTGVFQGTFTKPMPDGKGGVIQPTGKAFSFPMATVSIWRKGRIVEEHLFWDNQTFLKQVGLS